MYFKIKPEHLELIKQKMKLARIINMSAYIRKMCVDGYIVNFRTDELKEMCRLMSITSNNVNQLAKRVNSGDVARREDIADVQRQLDEIFKGLDKLLRQYSELIQKLR